MKAQPSDFLAQTYMTLATTAAEAELGGTFTHGIEFNLTQVSLARLLRLKARGQELKFSRQFVLDWQHYALFGDEIGAVQQSWSFTLNYEAQGMLHTLITRDGDITNQVCATLLPDPLLQRQLWDVYLWLTAQLLSKLNLRKPRGLWIETAAWGGAIAIVLLLTLLNIGTVFSQPLLILPLVLLVGGVQWLLVKLLDRSLYLIQRLLVRQMLWGKFASDRQRQQQALQYLRRL